MGFGGILAEIIWGISAKVSRISGQETQKEFLKGSSGGASGGYRGEFKVHGEEYVLKEFSVKFVDKF